MKPDFLSHRVHRETEEIRTSNKSYSTSSAGSSVALHRMVYRA